MLRTTLAALAIVLSIGSALRGEGLGWPGPSGDVLAPERVYPYQSFCGYPCDFWFTAEVNLGRIKEARLPPLATEGSLSSLAILDRPGTVVVIGEEKVSYDPFVGGLFTGGVWLNYDQTVGLEGGYHFLAEQSRSFLVVGNSGLNAPVVGRPFTNALDGAQTVSLIAVPGISAGAVSVETATAFQGAEAHLLCNLVCNCEGHPYRVDAHVGVRYLELTDEVGVEEITAFDTAAGPTLAGTTFAVFDQFDARTRFYGGTLGARAEYRYNCWVFDVVGRVGLGVNHQVIGVTGGTATTPPVGPATTTTGGLLAQLSNSGQKERDAFGVVPEIGIKVGYQVCGYCQLFAGYSFLYWTDVLRAGDQIDLTVNPNFVPSLTNPPIYDGPQRPETSFKESNLWVQTFRVGMEVRY